jgi:hypothetical protein
MVVNVDNLTSLDLSALLKHHRFTKAALTAAAHVERFKIPFGQLFINDGTIVRYAEKPSFPISICSGTYVLSKAARSIIGPRRALGAPQLVDLLLKAKLKVSAFSHSSPWIDVNDSNAVAAAEELIAINSARFELWRTPPISQMATLCVLRGNRLAIAKAPKRLNRPGNRSLLSEPVLPQDESPLQTAYRIWGQFGDGRGSEPRILVSYDDLDIRKRQRIRHHIFVAELSREWKPAVASSRLPISWKPFSDFLTGSQDKHASSRTIAYLRRYIASQNSRSVRH